MPCLTRRGHGGETPVDVVVQGVELQYEGVGATHVPPEVLASQNLTLLDLLLQ